MTLVSASNGGNGTMSNIDNIITFSGVTATQVGSENIVAGSYAILLTDDQLNTTIW